MVLSRPAAYWQALENVVVDLAGSIAIHCVVDELPARPGRSKLCINQYKRPRTESGPLGAMGFYVQ
jgi:hypothetical protein